MVGQYGFATAIRAIAVACLHEEVSWNEADFRCLHLCFLKRSSRDRENSVRRNIIETFGPTRLHTLWYALSALIGFKREPSGSAHAICADPKQPLLLQTFFPAAA